MSMSIAALEILEEAQFSPTQARALARVFETESMKVEFAALRADLAEARQTMKMEFAAVRAEIAEKRQATKADIADSKAEMIRWTLLTMMGQTTLLAGVIYFLLQNIR